MKDNIDKKHIGNRKIIIELRYDAIPSIIDKKGTIVEVIEKANIFNILQWEIGNEIIIRDNEIKDEATNVITVAFNRFSFISYNIDSIESFYAKFKKIYEAIISVIGNPNIRRIGCRIIGTYIVKSNNYSDIITHLQEAFPAKFFLAQYPVRDFMFRLEHDNGMYQLGPLNLEDDFYEREFRGSKTIKHVGFVIDTDNYLTNEVKSINDKELIKDIYILSLSVEKDLYTNLANL
ncbi:MAG: hypothetical protein IKV26_07680 [Paludibacteraceae bacterium]|nr:hypothetical protein [Paludibacteraceae bacterium]